MINKGETAENAYTFNPGFVYNPVLSEKKMPRRNRKFEG
jgi:hypothetical protein